MALTTITRSTITDDDGSGTVGTIWNAACLSTAVYSRVDALLASSSGLEIRGPFVVESSDENSVQTPGGFRERGRSASMGIWTDVAYAATDFGTSTAASTWTVESSDIKTRRYMAIGKTLFYDVAISAGSVGAGAPTVLYLDLPSGFTASGPSERMARYYDPAGAIGSVVVSPGDDKVGFVKLDGSAWVNSTNSMSVYGLFVIPVA